ncbi:hypothetical protein [Cytobacillus sp.]|uniref:hypothetical protein n=1 Tax=Cytobacillus sp. TaxID=2675269 RepID=UPI0028BED728|nr:hypothetical protein [Cytobacillus sp.]
MHDHNIPELTLLLESMNGAFTTESIVTNSMTEYDITAEDTSSNDEYIDHTNKPFIG